MKIYELRQGESLLISGAEALDIVRASMRIPREQYNQLLEKLLIEIADRKPLSSDKVKLVISGSLLDSSEFIKTIEDLGGLVVSDDLCTGTRYFLELIDVDLPPLKGIARRYLGRPPCARMRPFSLRFNHLIEQVRKYQADAVIYEAIKFCDLYGLDKPVFKEELQALGIPVLELDLEYGGGGAVGQIRTRVEAFIEMLKSKKDTN